MNLESQIAALNARLEEMQRDIRAIEADVKCLNATANRWKGAFGTLLGVGALIGWAANWVSNHLSWFK